MRASTALDRSRPARRRPSSATSIDDRDRQRAGEPQSRARPALAAVYFDLGPGASRPPAARRSPPRRSTASRGARSSRISRLHTGSSSGGASVSCRRRRRRSRRWAERLRRYAQIGQRCAAKLPYWKTGRVRTQRAATARGASSDAPKTPKASRRTVTVALTAAETQASAAARAGGLQHADQRRPADRARASVASMRPAARSSSRTSKATAESTLFDDVDLSRGPWAGSRPIFPVRLELPRRTAPGIRATR